MSITDPLVQSTLGDGGDEHAALPDDHEGEENTPNEREPTLATLLVLVAHRMSDGQAIALIAVGATLSAAVLLAAPTWWRFSLLGASLAGLGTWIVLERDGRPSAWRRVAQQVVALIGGASLFVFTLSLLTRALGIWIS